MKTNRPESNEEPPINPENDAESAVDSVRSFLAGIFEEIEEEKRKNDPQELASKTDEELLRASLVPIHVMCRRYKECAGCPLESKIYPCAGTYIEEAVLYSVMNAKQKKSETESDHE
jgi:hypothetical protein